MDDKKKLEKAIKALEHYANIENWGKINYPKYNQFHPPDEKFYWQGGPIEPHKFAESTLKKIKGG